MIHLLAKIFNGLLTDKFPQILKMIKQKSDLKATILLTLFCLIFLNGTNGTNASSSAMTEAQTSHTSKITQIFKKCALISRR